MLFVRACGVLWLFSAVLSAAEPRPICAGCDADIGAGQSHGPRCPYRPQTPGNGGGATSHPTPANTNQMVTMSLLQGLLQGLEQADAQEQERAAEAQRQEAIRRAAEEEARRQAALAELRRLAGVVDDQRRRRDLDGKDSLEGLSAAMGAGFDTPLPGATLPKPEPTGDPMVVDLRDRRGIVLPGMEPPPKPTTKAEVDDARAAAAQRERIRRMAEEAADAKALLKRLTDLEARLVESRARQVSLRREGVRLRRDMDGAQREVEAAVASAIEHAISLATFGLEKAHGAGLERMTKIRSDSAVWNETVRSTNSVNTLLEKIRNADGDYHFLTADRDPVKDLIYLGERFELTEKHVKVGQAIVGSGMSLWREWQASKTITANQPALQQLEVDRRREAAANQQLVAEIHAARVALAKRLGVPLSEVPFADPAPPKKRGIGYDVPHPYDTNWTP